MLNFKKIFTPAYLLAVDSAMLHRSDWILLMIGIALTVVGIVTMLTGYYAPNHISRKLWRRLATLSLTIGLLELLWFGFRYENVTVLGTHALAFLILIVGAVWLYSIIKYRLTTYRTELDFGIGKR